MKRAIISILVVGLFLTVAALPATSSVEPKSDGEDKVLSIMYGADGKGIKGDEVTISAADAEKLTNDITEFKTWIEENRPFKDFQLTEEEKTALELAGGGQRDGDPWGDFGGFGTVGDDAEYPGAPSPDIFGSPDLEGGPGDADTGGYGDIGDYGYEGDMLDGDTDWW